MFFFALSLAAQKTHPVPESYHRDLLTLKLVPLPLLDLTPAIQVAAELRLWQQQTFQLEYGYINSNFYKIYSNDFSGFKLKGEYRFYDVNPEKLLRNRFLGIQYMHKQLIVEGHEFFWRNNRSFQELMPTKLVNYTNSIYGTAGQVVPLFGPVLLELTAGLGVRRLDIVNKDVPIDAEPVIDPDDNSIFNFGLSNNRRGTFYHPALLFSLKIVVPILD